MPSVKLVAICLASSLFLICELANPASGCAVVPKIIKSIKGKIFGKKDKPARPDIPAYPKGCFQDVEGNRDLPAFAGYSAEMNSAYCHTKCADSRWEVRYKYFGLQGGDQCWCGKAFGAHGESKDSCTMRCVGNDDEMCGAEFFNNVYEMPDH